MNVSCELKLTLIDGKILCFIMKAAYQRCPLCLALPTDMNDVEKQKNGLYPLQEDALSHGLNDLHFKLHCLDMVLHLSYKSVLPATKHQARGVELQEAVAARKIVIQNRFKSKLNLLIDIPKPSGGTTNSGNTTRRAFKDPKILSEILEVDYELISNLKKVMTVISIKQKIDHEKFKELCDETIEIYKKNYEKFAMKPTVHKVLFHGPDIIKHSAVPVAYLTEEAAESKVKHIRYYREHFSRKDSSTHTMADIMHRSLDSSDPVIVTSMGQKKKKKQERLPDDLKKFFTSDITGEFIETSDTEDEEINDLI